MESKLATKTSKEAKQKEGFPPRGPARHDPTSIDWVSVMTEQKEKKKQSSKMKHPESVLVEQKNKKHKRNPANKAQANPEMIKKKITKGKDNDLIL